MNADVDQAKVEAGYLSEIETACSKRNIPIQAKTFLRGYRTKAQPVLLRCADDQNYMVKGMQAGRQIINDQIVARLGMMLGAPVGEPQLIYIPAELIEIEPRLAHISPGAAHGTLLIPQCDDHIELIATSEPNNRTRLAHLAVLYGWIVPGDRQFLFSMSPPRIIYSVDHGHFFPNGPDWKIEDLLNASFPILPECFSGCSLTTEELSEALDSLAAVTVAQIIQAVASPPDEWGLTIEERVQLVHYLIRRQKELPKVFVPPS